MPTLKVQYRVGDGATAGNDAFIKPHLMVVNTGTMAVSLSTRTIRYWYTIDTSPAPAQTAVCDFATLGCNNVTESFATVSPARTGADNLFQVGFAAGACNLAAGASTGDIQLRFNKAGFVNYAEAGDYSYDPTKTSYMDWNKVTLYQNGTLIWGIEP